MGLGWDERQTDGQDFDLDASVFMYGDNGKALTDNHFVFYNTMVSPCRSVEHTGDNRTGEGEGDDELFLIDLELVPMDMKIIAVGVTIHDHYARRQSIGQVANAFIRIVNNET